MFLGIRNQMEAIKKVSDMAAILNFKMAERRISKNSIIVATNSDGIDYWYQTCFDAS
jgi:hypothetical protein